MHASTVVVQMTHYNYLCSVSFSVATPAHLAEMQHYSSSQITWTSRFARFDGTGSPDGCLEVHEIRSAGVLLSTTAGSVSLHVYLYHGQRSNSGAGTISHTLFY
jgi:hypothetical protein